MSTEKSNTDDDPDLDEVRLLAMILGEVDDEEREAIEARLRDDPEFAQKRDRLQQTAGLMEEAFVVAGSSQESEEASLRLSPERRERIFSANRPKPSRLLRFDFNHPLIPIGVAASLFFVLFVDKLDFGGGGAGDTATELINLQGSMHFESPPPPPEGEPSHSEPPMRTSLQSVASSISPITEEFIEDVGATESKYNLTYSRGTETGGVSGNFSDPGGELEVRQSAGSSRGEFVRRNKFADFDLQEDAASAKRDFSFSVDSIDAQTEPSILVDLKKVESPLSESEKNQFIIPGRSNLKIANDEVIELSSLSVDASENEGYQATTVLAGTRAKGELRDIPSGNSDDDLFELSPFEVDSSNDSGSYLAEPETLISHPDVVSDIGRKRKPTVSKSVVSFFDSKAVVPAPQGQAAVTDAVGGEVSGQDTDGIAAAGSAGAMIGATIGSIQESKERERQDTLGQQRAYNQAITIQKRAVAKEKAELEEHISIAEGLLISNEELDEMAIRAEFAEAKLAILQDKRQSAIARSEVFEEMEQREKDAFAKIAALKVSEDLKLASGLTSDLVVVGAPKSEIAQIPEEVVELDPKPEPAKPNPNLVEYPEFSTSEAPQSTFSLNVSDVSYRLTQSHLRNQELPPAGTLRTEEFINAFDYGDPEASPDESIGFAWERARWPFQHNRDVLRFSIKTAATGRLATKPMNLVLAIDSSGSMARADRMEIVGTVMEIIGRDLQASDSISVIAFNRRARLLLDFGLNQSVDDLDRLVAQLNPQGGTDMEAGLRLAYETAQRSFRSDSANRIILFTDGAANLGNTVAEDLTRLVEENRRVGIALDCFGIGFDGHNDAMLERLSRNGDGRYRFLRSAKEVGAKFGDDMLGSLRPSAYDVKVQVEFNPERVISYQLLGYQQHQLRSEDFRDNTVDAAEMSAAEAGNALYLATVDDAGKGDIGVVRARFRDAATGQYEERSWNLPYRKSVADLERAPASLRLAAVAASFAALLNESSFAQEIEYKDLLNLSQDFQEFYPQDPEVLQLPRLLITAQRLSGSQ